MKDEQIPVVSLPELRAIPLQGSARHPIGIAAVMDPAPAGPTGEVSGSGNPDFKFGVASNIIATNITVHGGAIGSADPVHLIYWGSVWQTDALSQIRQQFSIAVRRILAGPWMSGLRQYGVKRCSFGSELILSNPPPPLLPQLFTEEHDINRAVSSLIENGSFPEPDEPRGRNLYVVVMPPNAQREPLQTSLGKQVPRGAHTWFNSGTLIDVDNSWVAWVGGNNPQALFTFTVDTLTSTFCHELAEMCTDPEDQGWFVTGGSNDTKEIGDICNLQDKKANGINFESYWSAYDGVCLIPMAWSLRRTLAGAGVKLNGQGLVARIGTPIPSANKWIVNL
jgi:hypothetical protein